MIKSANRKPVSPKDYDISSRFSYVANLAGYLETDEYRYSKASKDMGGHYQTFRKWWDEGHTPTKHKLDEILEKLLQKLPGSYSLEITSAWVLYGDAVVKNPFIKKSSISPIQISSLLQDTLDQKKIKLKASQKKDIIIKLTRYIKENLPKAHANEIRQNIEFKETLSSMIQLAAKGLL